ncbi:hypothetical protein [Microbulbifer agarilyticus]|uniref:hypothetical protein n=1 Tax=Microbulbifer agarilyticus TaxID=260552 RepID=UPI001CD7A5DB|nr:hypothetical protein [Microbulbifer agarilyticus]MCA0902031.1 hypothetical protein [Microbulbifer agarilyticus]
MELSTLLILIFLFFLLFKPGSKSNKNNSKVKNSGNARKNNTAVDSDWLQSRWRLAQEHYKTGNREIFQDWYFERATERQIERLKEDGVSFSKQKLSKGQASDLIGLKEPAEEDNIEVLKFFKVPTRGIKQTQARHEVSMIFSKEENISAWATRPATSIQKEFFKFFGLKLPKNLTHEQAIKIIRTESEKIIEIDEPKFESWDAYESVLYELFDREFREDYGLKKPSLSLIRQATASLMESGITFQEMEDDIDIVVQKLLAIKPELETA